MRHVIELRPDICSLDMGSLNMGSRVFINTPEHLQTMAVAIREAGVLPELEVFETGHLLLAKRMIETGHIKAPGMFQICLGIAWGQPATPEAMSYMRNLLPAGSPWFAFGISLYQFPMVAQAVLLGGHVRVGLEDNLYLEKGKLAPSNAALVEKAGRIIEILGDQVASPPRRGRSWGCRAHSTKAGDQRRFWSDRNKALSLPTRRAGACARHHSLLGIEPPTVRQEPPRLAAGDWYVFEYHDLSGAEPDLSGSHPGCQPTAVALLVDAGLDRRCVCDHGAELVVRDSHKRLTAPRPGHCRLSWTDHSVCRGDSFPGAGGTLARSFGTRLSGLGVASLAPRHHQRGDVRRVPAWA